MKGAVTPLRYDVGQYMYINIPEVSQLAWHPFTLSSEPLSSSSSSGSCVLTHHIKSMGDNQWTARLHTLAQRLARRGLQRDAVVLRSLVLNIDGPYGVPVDVTGRRHVLLIAGGIGITPLHALYKHLVHCCCNGSSSYGNNNSHRQLISVRLIWAVRHAADISAFEESVSVKFFSCCFCAFLNVIFEFCGFLCFFVFFVCFL